MIPQQTSLPAGNRLTPSDCSPENMSETRLLAAARNGHSASFESLCAAHTGRLLKAAFNITRNWEDAQDAVQDSFMRAFVNIKRFRGTSTFSTWLTRIVINSALMIRRKNRRGHHVFLDDLAQSGESSFHLQIPDAAPNPEQRYVQRERKRVLRKAISHLRPRIRAVIEVGQLQELSMKETAKVLDISLAAAKGRFFHGRAALRRSPALRAIAQAARESAA